MKEDVNLVLQRTADQVRAGTALLIAKTADWQIIKQYLGNRLNDLQLTASQQEKLERYQYIYNQLVSGKYTEQEVISSVKKIYNIEIVQAYEDLNCSKEIFSTLFNVNKRFEVNMELQAARDMRRKFMEVGDFKSAAAVQKNIVMLLKELPDEIENGEDMFQGHSIEAVFDPTLLGAPAVDMQEVLKAINAKRNKKISIDMFEELPFEDKPNE